MVNTHRCISFRSSDMGYVHFSRIEEAEETDYLGFPLSFGVFQNYYFTADGPFKGNTSTSYIGITSTGIFFLGAPLMTYVTETFPRWRRQMIWAGWPLCITSLLASSFATSIPALIGLQGVLYAVGELILYLPLMSIINEWFIERRGLAYGIVTCSTGVTGTALPFLTEALLTRLGYQTTLRVYCIILTVTTGPLLLLLKPRLSASDLPEKTTFSLTFLRAPLFWLYTTSNTIHSLAMFLPSIFLPQFATSIGLTPTIGALLLALLAIGQILGQLTFGYLSDRSASTKSHFKIPLNILIFLSSFLAGLSALTLWGLAHNTLLLALFAVTFGFAANAYVVLWARMGLVLCADDADTQAGSVLATFGMFSFQKGVGSLVAGPVSSALVGVGVSAARDRFGGYAADGEFAGIVLFTGACLLLSSLFIATWYVLPRRLRDRVSPAKS
jgi:MFS family permease